MNSFLKNKFYLFFFGIFIISTIIFLAHFFIVGKAVYGDGRYYYSYLPTFFISHTLNFSKAFVHTDIPSWFFTPLGLPANVYPIGSALFWAIPYLLFYSVSFLLGQTNPYAIWLQIPIGIWTVGIGTIGLFFLEKSLRSFFDRTTTGLVLIAIFFSTNLLFYGAIDVLNSHIITFFLSCLLVFLYFKKVSSKVAILEGILIGLLMLVRPQEAVFVILPICKYFRHKTLLLISLFTTGIVFFPQLLIWHLEWGTWFVNPYLHVATFHVLSPNIWGVLFNHETGLFLWTPISILATIGLILFAYRQPKIGAPFLLVFLSELYVIASWSIWWEGASYSARMFVSSLPLVAFGLAYLFCQRVFKTLRFGIVGFFCVFNMLLILYYLLQH